MKKIKNLNLMPCKQFYLVRFNVSATIINTQIQNPSGLA